jgi:branched-chain amino acid transport system substrate-binding protein
MKAFMTPIALGAAALALLAAAPAQAQQKSLKIGFIATFTGPAGILGQHLYDGFMLGVDEAGGKLGGLPTDVIKEDDQLKPDIGLQAAQKLIEKDKVDIVSGIVFSNVMMAVYKPVIDSKTILVSSNAGPSPIAGKLCSPYFFSTAWQNDAPHEAMGKYLQDKGVKKLYLMAPNYQAGKDALTGVKRAFKGTIAGEVYTSLSQLDYAAEIAQMRAAKPDALYVFYPGGFGISFLKQYAQAGLAKEIPLYSAFTVDTTTLAAQGDAAVGTFQSAFWNVDLKIPASEKFVAAFEKKYGYVPSTYSAQAFDSAQLIDSALKAAGGDPGKKEAIIAAMRKADFPSIRGAFKFNTNHFPIENFYLLETVKGEDGKLKQVTRATIYENHADAYASECAMK